MRPLRPNMRPPRRPAPRLPLLLGVGAMAVLGLSLLVMLRTPRTVYRPLIAPPPPPVAVVAPPEPAAEPEVPAVPTVTRGTCASIGLLPAAMVQTLTAEEEVELVELVQHWLAAPQSWHERPVIAYQRGVVHVESEEDRGDDPPYPRSAGPEAERVCGSAAGWLRTHLRERLAGKATPDDGITCQGNVCCYAGMEYSPNGLVVFRHGDVAGRTIWSLDAWAQFDVAALGADYAAANLRHVRASLRRLARTTCPGEPAVAD